MYGLIQRAIQSMVCTRFDAATWEAVKREAGVDDEVFVANATYPDDVTYKLVGATSKLTGLSAEDVLEAFGEYWVLVTAADGYGGLMDATGSTLPEFLSGLNNLHTRVQLIFPALRPPSITCTDITKNSLTLHYRTFRPGLAPFVVGLLKGLGKRFATPVDVRLVESAADGADHDVFAVRWAAAAATD